MRNCLLEKKWVIRVCGDPAGAGNRVVQGFHFFPKGNIWLAGNVGLQLLVRMPRLTRSPSLLHLRLKLATRRHARRYRVLCSLSSRSSRATILHRARAESTENARGNQISSTMQSVHNKVWH